MARVVEVPVAARTWAKNRRERTCAHRDARFSSDHAGRIVAVEAGLRALAVPADPDAVAVRPRLGLDRVQRLMHQGMCRRADEIRKEDRLSPVG